MRGLQTIREQNTAAAAQCAHQAGTPFTIEDGDDPVAARNNIPYVGETDPDGWFLCAIIDKESLTPGMLRPGVSYGQVNEHALGFYRKR